MTSTSLNPVDTIWLNTDRADNLMVIEALVRLDGTLDRDRFLRVVQRRVVDRYPVFSRRPVTSRVPGRLPRWREVPGFDVADHVHEAVLAEPGDDAALQDYVAGFLGTPLRRDRPLWEVHLVEGRPEGTALFVRLHHAMADGIALTRVLVSLTDEVAATPDEGVADAAGPSAPAAARSRARGPGVLGSLARTALATLVGVGRVGPVLAKLLLSRLPLSSFTGGVVDAKRVVWARSLGLAQVKEVAAASGATVNDVLVSALAGALERYQRHHGTAPVDLSTMVPVNLRPLDRPLPASLGNRFAVVLLRLPSSSGHPWSRLGETKRRMDRIKGSPEPLVTFVLMHAIGLAGTYGGRALARFFADKAIGVTTNVPGPREHRYLAGTRVVSLLGWVPGSGGQSVGTCIFTYAGQVHVGFKVDARTVPDPDTLLDAFHAELDVLFETCGVTPEADRAPLDALSG